MKKMKLFIVIAAVLFYPLFVCGHETKKTEFPFFLYRDYGVSGSVHYSPSGWMGHQYSLRLWGNCRENPYSGQTCIKIVYDPSIVDSKKSWAGIYWLHPANNWGIVPDAGYNLTGAVKFVFHACGAKGDEIINFFIGGVTGKHGDSGSSGTLPVTLKPKWQKFEIKLDAVNLTNIIGGFGFSVAKEFNPEKIVFYLDDMYYEGREGQKKEAADPEAKSGPAGPKTKPADEKGRLLRYLSSVESRNTGLYESYQNTACSIEDMRFISEIPLMRTENGYLDNLGFLYDNALCLMALMDTGELAKAEKLLEVFQDNFFMNKNGLSGLYNAYYIGNHDYFFYTKPEKYNLLVMGLDGNRIYFKSNIFIGLAAQYHYSYTSSPAFLDFIMKIYRWTEKIRCIVLPNETDGPLAMGYGPGLEAERIFLTENILDHYAFLKILITMMETGDKNVVSAAERNNVSLEAVEQKRNNILYWIKYEAFNERGTFNRGATGPDVNGDYAIDTVEALDVNTAGILALGPQELMNIGTDPYSLMETIEKKFKVSVKVKGQTYSGFDFTTTLGYHLKRSRPMIWWEGTAQMCLCCRIMAQYASSQGQADLAEQYNRKYRFYLKQMDLFSRNAVRSPWTALPYVSELVDKNTILYSFNDLWSIPRGRTDQNAVTGKKEPRYVISLSSTLWRYFAATGLNPLLFFPR
ncbi:MAG: hypothetical protein PHF84_06530 [bacterium]|nr:hypothetical protein [bacterium]